LILNRGFSIGIVLEVTCSRQQTWCGLEWLPPYAPKRNPVEQLWNHVKYEELANFTTVDIPTLDEGVTDLVGEAKFDLDRLWNCYDATPLILPDRTAVI
jgi:hypothetical protein